VNIALCALVAAFVPAVAIGFQAPVRIGQSIEELTAAAGHRNVASGGPESKTHRHYELSGPLATTLTGQRGGTAYLVFRVASNGKSEMLVYAAWNFASEYEQSLLKAFGVAPGHQRGPNNTICAKLSPGARLALANSSIAYSRQAVLETAASSSQARPTFAELCGVPNAAAAR
jgi:hypothetical protein